MAKKQSQLIGVEIGGTKLQIAVGDASGKLMQVHRRMVNRARGAAGIRKQIEAVLAKILRTSKTAAVRSGLETGIYF